MQKYLATNLKRQSENTTKSGSSSKENAEKNKPELIVTSLHRLKIIRKPEVPLGQLTLIEEGSDGLDLLHLSNDGTLRRLEVSISKDPAAWQVKQIGRLHGVANSALGHSNDIFVSATTGRIYVSYPHVDERGCASLKLDEITLNQAGLLDSQSTIYQTKPCVLPPYGLHNTGGRIVE